MSKTNLPGFNADASLYRKSRQNRVIAGAFNTMGEGQRILPQAMALSKCLQGCHNADSPDYCQQQCFWQDSIDGGGNGGGGGKGGGSGAQQSCAPGCGPCQADPDSSSGGYKTCVRHDCSTYNIACRTRSREHTRSMIKEFLTQDSYFT